VNLCHFFDFFHPKNPYEKYTPPYGTARGDPILMEGTVLENLFEVRSFPANRFQGLYINRYREKRQLNLSQSDFI
jgi:hypothetical protein